MKNVKIFFLLTALTASISLISCVQEKKKETKITDITATTKSNDAMNSFRQGLILLDQGDRQKARELFSKAIEQDPTMGIAYVMRSGTSNSAQDFTNDMTKAKDNLANATPWENWYYQYFETFNTSDYNKRLEIVKMMADSFPDAARTQIDLGNVYSQGNDEAKARECYQKAIDLDSNWVGGYTAMGASYLFLEPRDFKKAEDYAAKCGALAPGSPAAEIALGDCYRAQNDLTKARDAYGKAITIDPSAAESYFKKGHANTFLGNYDEARQNYMEGGKHDVDMLAANGLIAYTYLYAGDPKMAQDALIADVHHADSSGLSKDQIDNEKLSYLGDCERICIHTGDAAGLAKLQEMTDPMNTAVGDVVGTNEAKLTSQATILYGQAMLAAIQGKYDDAKAKAEQIKTTLNPITDPNKLDQYHFVMGYISMQQKNYGDAVHHFEDSHPNNSIYTKYWLAKANEAAGNKDKAQGLYNEIAVYNFNSIDYALIRNEVVNRKPST